VRYVVLIAYEPGRWEAAGAEERQAFFDAHHAFERYVADHGKRLSSAALADADTATTVRHPGGDGQAVVMDGPFVELTEQVGGYYDVELPDLDTAIAAATLLPRSYAVEVRPVVGVEGYESV
jgi:hypothetical protein